MKRLATILLGLMLTSCSIGYYDSGVLLATTANISVQPAWGPAGYDCAHYYYFPDYNFYYDVNRALFYYHHNSRWISAKHLPYGLGYPRDLYKYYKVVLNIRDPWNYNRRHRSEYKHFRGIHTQPVLRDRHPNRPPQYSRPPQGRPQPKPQVKPQAKPQYGGNGAYGQSNRNTIRNSRNNNTSRNNVAPQQSTPQRSNSNVQQTPQRQQSLNEGSRVNSRQRPSSSSVRGTQTKSNQTTKSTVKSNSTSRKSKDNKNSTANRSNSSGGSRSTGSRGR